jgi:hypothetical protein
VVLFLFYPSYLWDLSLLGSGISHSFMILQHFLECYLHLYFILCVFICIGIIGGGLWSPPRNPVLAHRWYIVLLVFDWCRDADRTDGSADGVRDGRALCRSVISVDLSEDDTWHLPF